MQPKHCPVGCVMLFPQPMCDILLYLPSYVFFTSLICNNELCTMLISNFQKQKNYKKFPFFFDDFQKGSIYQMRRKYSFSGTKTYKRGGRSDTRYKKSDILSALTIKQGRRIPVCQYLRYWLFWQLFFYGCCYRHCSQKLAVV